jgi:DNA polymerase III subunit delta
MTAIREAELPSALKRGGASLRGVLVYGGDDVRVAGVVEQVVKTIAAAEDVTRLSAASLRSDPVLLDDALRSQSFLGGRQLVLVSEITDVHAKLIEPALQVPGASNFLVLAAGSLNKSSALRSLCEGATDFLCVPIYEDRPADILDLVVKRLAASGHRLLDEAADRFMALCGTDRALALNEADKLSLYAKGQTEISEADVIACCGDQASYGLDGAIDAALAGDSLAADRMLYSLDDSDWRSVLPILASHVSRLSILRVDADRLGGIEAALRAAKPPVFFGRKQAFSQQLRALDSEAVLRVQSAVERAVEESRRYPDLANGIISRLFFSMAAEARRGLRG